MVNNSIIDHYYMVYSLVCRAFLEQILQDTMMEIRQSGTFQSLTDAVIKEKDEKSNMEDIIRRYM